MSHLQFRELSKTPVEAVVLGTSAGGVDALLKIVPKLPAEFPVPMLAVIHLPPDRESVLPELLASTCRVRVKEAEDKEPLENGTVYFAPPNYHLLVEANRHLSLSSDEPVMFSRPSIDVLFQSAADVFGSKLLGIILTGANPDGARGLQAVCDAGGVGVVQTPNSAEVPTMPAMAGRACSNAVELTLEEVADLLRSLRPTSRS